LKTRKSVAKSSDVKSEDKLIKSNIPERNYFVLDVSSKEIAWKKKPVIIGYALSIGAVLLYLPILVDVIDAKIVDDYSIQTWWYTFVGFSSACIYPFKKKYHFSTYAELAALSIQSYLILCAISFFKKNMTHFLCCSTVFALISQCLLTLKVPDVVFAIIHVFSVVMCNYALLPQVIFNFRKGSATWSPITSFMSVCGNGIRVFTTLELTKDKFLLSGYLYSTILNFLLFLQYLIYNASSLKLS